MLEWLGDKLRWLGIRDTQIGRVVALILLIGALLLQLSNPAPVEILKLKTFDLYQLAFPRAETERRVMIVDIDEESLGAYGQWPWPRSKLAAMVDRIREAGGAAIAFDIMFPETDRLSPASYAQSVEIADPAVRAALEKLPSNDQTFADALSRTLVVLAVSGYWRKLDDEHAGAGEQSMLATIGEDPRPWLFQFPGVVRNIPVLEKASAGRGLITINPERDGIIRRVPLVAEAGGRVWPALSLELLRVATGGGAVMVKTSSDLGIDSVAVQGVPIATDERGRLWVHFSKYDRGRYISVKDVMENPQKAAAALNGKLVLIGTSAAGLFDLRATPLEGVVPGVDVHAQILENVFDQANGAAPQLHRPNWALAVELLASVGIASAMIVFVPLLGGLVSLISGAVLAAALVAGAAWLFLTQGLVFDVLFPLITSFAVFLALVFMNYLREESQKRQIRSAFGQYLSPQFVEELASNPGKLKLGGETKDMTILFSDVRNFTTISETYKTNPQGLTQLINSLLTPLSLEVMNRKGTIDKYMGDNVMAFWNAPLDDPDHARNACAAALSMVKALENVNAGNAAGAAGTGEAVRRLEVGVGVNTGQCVVGNMGSDLRFDYTVLGDAVNLASRLEGQTKGYGVRILVGSTTAAAAEDAFALIPVDLIRVKGKKEPEAIFALVGDEAVRADPAFASLRQETEAMIEAYRGQRWKVARGHAGRAAEIAKSFGASGLYDLYLTRIANFEQNPPPKDWDGVHVAETK